MQALLANIAQELEDLLQTLREHGFRALKPQYLSLWLHTGQDVRKLISSLAPVKTDRQVLPERNHTALHLAFMLSRYIITFKEVIEALHAIKCIVRCRLSFRRQEMLELNIYP